MAGKKSSSTLKLTKNKMVKKSGKTVKDPSSGASASCQMSKAPRVEEPPFVISGPLLPSQPPVQPSLHPAVPAVLPPPIRQPRPLTGVVPLQQLMQRANSKMAANGVQGNLFLADTPVQDAHSVEDGRKYDSGSYTTSDDEEFNEALAQVPKKTWGTTSVPTGSHSALNVGNRNGQALTSATASASDAHMTEEADDEPSDSDEEPSDEEPSDEEPSDVARCGSNKPRGLARRHRLGPGEKRPVVTVNHDILDCKEIPGWFLKEMRFEWTVCWPKWRDVSMKVKLRLWKAFKNDHDISLIDEGVARRMWMSQAQKWYRGGMGAMKKDALEKFKTTDVKDLIGKRKPKWMLSRKAWRSFVKYWNEPKTVQVSNSNKRSRATEGAGIHRMGRNGLKTRIRQRMEKTGVRPSPFEILLEVYGGAEGEEVRNQKFASAWQKYTYLFKEKYGEQSDPLCSEPDFELWDVCEEVSGGRKKGRRLGFGTVRDSNVFAAPTKNNIPSPSEAAAQALLDAEIAKREAMEVELVEVKKQLETQATWMAKIQQQMDMVGMGMPPFAATQACDLPHPYSQ